MLVAEVDALEEALTLLSEGTPLYQSDLSDERRSALREHFLLTNKPVMAVLNIGEDQLAEANELASALGTALPGAEVLPLSVQLEELICLKVWDWERVPFRCSFAPHMNCWDCELS